MFKVFVMTHDISVMGTNKVKKKKMGQNFLGVVLKTVLVLIMADRKDNTEKIYKKIHHFWAT